MERPERERGRTTLGEEQAVVGEGRPAMERKEPGRPSTAQ